MRMRCESEPPDAVSCFTFRVVVPVTMSPGAMMLYLEGKRQCREALIAVSTREQVEAGRAQARKTPIAATAVSRYEHMPHVFYILRFQLYKASPGLAIDDALETLHPLQKLSTAKLADLGFIHTRGLQTEALEAALTTLRASQRWRPSGDPKYSSRRPQGW